MAKNAITEVENKIKKILEDRETEMANLEEQAEQEAAAIEAANKAMDAATVVGDVKAYQKAKAERRDAEDAKEMHEKRFVDLSKKPLISKAEYEKAVADIYAEFAAAEDKTKQQLAKLSDDMHGAALALEEMIERANAVLHKLQNDVYRNADRQKTANGSYIGGEKVISEYDTIYWGKAGVTHYQYEQYTGHRVQ